MTRQVPDRLMLYEFLDLLLLCERDSEVHLQPLPQVTGVDKNNLFKLCDFQAVLCTEDEKKIRHLDHMYEVRCCVVVGISLWIFYCLPSSKCITAFTCILVAHKYKLSLFISTFLTSHFLQKCCLSQYCESEHLHVFRPQVKQ